MSDTTGAAPRERMRERLRSLYGADDGDAAFAALGRILDAFPARLRTRAAANRFNQADAVLITYGDTFLPVSDSPPEADRPLAALRAFAERHLDGLLSSIHILPFFPYSSDYGFSIVDYEQVNPELGRWEDVEALGRRFALMFDLVVNHCSAESPWFQAFLRGEPPYDNYFIVTDPSADEPAPAVVTPLVTAPVVVSMWPEPPPPPPPEPVPP